WRPWVPWTVGLSGCALIVASGVVSFYARSKYDEYAENGMVIEPPPDMLNLQEATDRANHYYRMAKYATIPAAIGTAAAFTGLIMLLVNRKVSRVPVVEVVPGGGGGASAHATWRF